MKQTMAEYLESFGTREVDREEELARALAAARRAVEDNKALSLRQATARNRVGKLLRKATRALLACNERDLQAIAFSSQKDVKFIKLKLKRPRLP